MLYDKQLIGLQPLRATALAAPASRNYRQFKDGNKSQEFTSAILAIIASKTAIMKPDQIQNQVKAKITLYIYVNSFE